MASLFRAPLLEFVNQQADSIVGRLSQQSARPGMGQISHLQVIAWASQIRELQASLSSLIERIPRAAKWTILLEYSIPVVGRRPDAVILGDGHIFVLEYKAGINESGTAAFNQAQAYALDLQDFHEESRNRIVLPLAVGTMRRGDGDSSTKGGIVAPSELANRLAEAVEQFGMATEIDPVRWDRSRYFAVPTLVEAAAAIYDQHDVREVSHSRAGKENLEATLAAILDAANYARTKKKDVLCIVTGVPGAGKTLAGLNAISHLVRTLDLEQDQAAFLSGNNPLVKVLRKALGQSLSRSRGRRISVRSLESVIQEMHRFVRDTFDSDRPPAHLAIVFDEAQRAWSRAKNLKKFGRDLSEPDMVLEIMGRHAAGSLIVALVGGGQEIHFGEAGLSAWGDALVKHSKWTVWTSPEAIDGGPSVAGSRLFSGAAAISSERLFRRTELHLATPKRSYQAESSAAWVNAVLNGQVEIAHQLAGSNFPIFLTRSLSDARRWLASRVAKNRRSGLVASSGAARLRADGIEPPTFNFLSGIDYDLWFLNPQGDVRSSNQLEVAMSEFELQGLELDHVGLLWGGDLLFPENRPLSRKFRGSRWVATQKSGANLDGQIDEHNLTLNKYRVLMTRFRKAMVIFVPDGDASDATRTPGEFNQVAKYLSMCGAPPLSEHS